MKRYSKQASALTVTALSAACLVFTGVAAADTGLGVTGAGSTNLTTSQAIHDYMNQNVNRVMAGSTNMQSAQSGASRTNGNTIANGAHGYGYSYGYGHGSGGGSTGSASNHSSANTNVNVSGGGSGNWSGYAMAYSSGGSGSGINLTGPGSTNAIMNVSNNMFRNTINNQLNILNGNFQTASTGNSFNDDNTIGGGGHGTGSASNSANTNTNVSVNNNAGYSGGNSTIAYSNGMASAGGIFLTGPGSTNRIVNYRSNEQVMTTVNDVAVRNQNAQLANSGSAQSNGNTVAGGSGSTGNASNAANTSTNVAINNASANHGSAVSHTGSMSSGSIGISGPGSTNTIENYDLNSSVHSTQNQVLVDNTSTQAAQSGSSDNSGNTIGGGGSTGSAHNNQGSNTSVNVH